jgi:hypothetical protein
MSKRLLKMNIDKKYVEKKHRVTDLNDINNTFKEIKHDMNNNFNRIDNTFKLIDSKIDSLRWVLVFLVAGIVAILIKLFV